jgi:hypothetical protein
LSTPPKLDMSDVGLKKLLVTYGVVTPPQGHWNRVHAGRPVLERPKAQPRRPGESGRVRLDARFSKVLSPAPPLSSAGPFASAAVPEDLEELHSLEMKAIGRSGVPKNLEGAHKGLRKILAQETRRRDKVANSGWPWDALKFDNPVAKRRLRLLNGIFLALAKRGHDGDAYERDGEIHARVNVGDTYLGIDVGVLGKHRTVRVSGYMRPAPDLPASTPLVLRIDPSFDGTATQSWCDDEGGKLEEKLVAIVAGIIVAGEDRFRRELREAEERLEQQRREAEKRRQEKLAALNRERLANLSKSGELLRRAQDIRSLVADVRNALADRKDLNDTELSAWEAWALGEADRIDPVLSGQFMSHLKPPTLDSDG